MTQILQISRIEKISEIRVIRVNLRFGGFCFAGWEVRTTD
ncbi:Uncharacterized protein dnm_005010 [Desulfonema magnum]|uniref:Uncharacterized protein n=1 Tax=Desulfonema magnum TaxID=45655 RepID=A0A975BG00_9BACT|nr:Uncharacterized protein dnm_005010 [Desulfonema magnum]